MEPFVKVGIISDKTIRFVLNGGYTFDGETKSGEHQVSFEKGKIRWEDKLYDTLLLEAAGGEHSSFVLKDVIIGVNFHWERKEDQRFQGSLKFIVEGDAMTAVNLIKTEDYLTSVISSEMSPTSSLELLKAHAVISRSWLLAQIEKNKTLAAAARGTDFVETDRERVRWYDREDHANFDVCADDHCQRYQGVSRAFDNIERVKEAIAATRGEVLVYEDEICDARFSKCCGGVVEEFQNCWEDIKYPYLAKLRDWKDNHEATPDLTLEAEAVKWIKTRPDAFCDTTDQKILSQVLNNYDQETTDFYRWTVRYDREVLSGLIKERAGIDVGEVIDLIPLERGASGRIVRLKIKGDKAEFIIGKELEIRRTLSRSHLYSSAFYVEKLGNTFVLHGSGWGHGVGLCQIGAAVMGEKGFTYGEILTHYYIDAEIKKLYN